MIISCLFCILGLLLESCSAQNILGKTQEAIRLATSKLFKRPIARTSPYSDAFFKQVEVGPATALAIKDHSMSKLGSGLGLGLRRSSPLRKMYSASIARSGPNAVIPIEAQLGSYRRKYILPKASTPCHPALISKSGRLLKRAVLVPDTFTSSPICIALEGGTSAIRRRNLCKSLQQVLDYSPATGKLVMVSKNSIEKSLQICEHMVEMDTVERGFRAEVRILMETLGKESPVLAQQLCEEYTNRVHSALKDIANDKDNIRLVSSRIEGPKGFFSRGAYGNDARFRLDPAIKLDGTRAYLEEYDDIKQAHMKLSQSLYELFLDFSQTVQLQCKTDECSNTVVAIRDHLQWIGESGRDFVLSRLDTMNEIINSPNIKLQELGSNTHINMFFDCQVP